MKKSTSEQVKKYWDEQASKYGDNYLATIPDKFLKDLEIKNILKYLPSKKVVRVVDIGCGNGYSIFQMIDKLKAKFVGIDYSEEMIKNANQTLKEINKKNQKRVSFLQGNVLELPFVDKSFEIAVSDRCLINLTSLTDQKKALREIARILKKGGLYIMCEDTQEGLVNLNKLRLLANLGVIGNRWHNLYLNEKKISKEIKKYFKVLTVDNFSSLYYIASRIFNAVSASDPASPDYLSVINKVAAELPAVGDYGPLKIFLLQKK